jgi:hypothetical protein
MNRDVLQTLGQAVNYELEVPWKAAAVAIQAFSGVAGSVPLAACICLCLIFVFIQYDCIHRCSFKEFSGALEYLHRSPASLRTRRKGKLVLWEYIWASLLLGDKYRDLALQVRGLTQGWRPFSVKKLLLRNPKKWIPGQIWKNLLRRAMDQDGLFWQ